MRKVAGTSRGKLECKIRVFDSSSCFSPTELANCHDCLVEMSQLLQSMDVLHRTYSAPAINVIQVSQIPLLFHSGTLALSSLLPAFHTNREVVLLVASARFKGMEVVSLVCVFPYGFGRPYCLCSLSCFETKGGSFESPKKEKRSHRRWRSRAVGKDAKGTLQVTLASLPRLVSSWTYAGDSLDSKRRIDK